MDNASIRLDESCAPNNSRGMDKPKLDVDVLDRMISEHGLGAVLVAIMGCCEARAVHLDELHGVPHPAREWRGASRHIGRAHFDISRLDLR